MYFNRFGRILLIISSILFIKIGYSQPKTTVGFTIGSGLPKLSIGYSVPDNTLEGVSLLKPINVGLFGRHALGERIVAGLDLTYYRLPLRVTDGRGNTIFDEVFTYLNIVPSIAYQPIKWASIGLNLSLRPLLNYSPNQFPPSTSLLSYYGPFLTVKPIRRVEIDIGYETYGRPFASAAIVGGYASFANSTLYGNLRFVLFRK